MVIADGFCTARKVSREEPCGTTSVAHFLVRLFDVVLRRLLIEMNRHGKLSHVDVDDLRFEFEEMTIADEFVDAHRGRHDHETKRILTAAPYGNNTREQTDEHVRGHTALVSFVDDDAAVLAEKEIVLYFFEQHTVSHEFNGSLFFTERALVSDLVRDLPRSTRMH